MAGPDLTVVEPLTPEQKEVRDSIIEVLDELRFKALKGELAGIAVATLEYPRVAQGQVGTVVSMTTDRPALYGAVHALAHRILEAGI